MPASKAPGDQLWEGLSWPQRDTVLGNGKLKRMPGQCWLETFVEGDEIFAVFLKGSVGLCPVSPEIGDKCRIHLRNAPAIVELSSEPEYNQSHWIADPAEVYLYTKSTLLAAFTAAPTFGFNFIEILCAQQAEVTDSLCNPTSLGVGRLARSLLARAGENIGQFTRVSVTQSELAFEIGLSRQWVNRLLRGLEKKGIARAGRGYVDLHSPTMLRDFL